MAADPFNSRRGTDVSKLLPNRVYASGLLAAGALVLVAASLFTWDALRSRAARPNASAACEPERTGAESRAAFAGRRRDRVRIVDNTLVSDTGEILRAAHATSGNTVFLKRSWWTTLRDRYGLNAVRLDTRISKRPTSAPYPDSIDYLVDVEAVFDHVDAAVERAAEAGMYVILANFTSCCGQWNLELNEVFWTEAASRYKDSPHVLFEIQNEPVEGSDYRPEDIAFQQEMFRFVRERAPDTHIILWSAMYGTKAGLLEVVERAQAIDYSNASVGVHLYWHERDDPEWSNLGKLRARYPVINTEFSLGEKTGKVYPEKVWAFAEETRLAWAYLDLRKTRRGFGNFGDGVLNTCVWAFNWPIPAQ
jgi:endoglucanase